MKKSIFSSDVKIILLVIAFVIGFSSIMIRNSMNGKNKKNEHTLGSLLTSKQKSILKNDSRFDYNSLVNQYYYRDDKDKFFDSLTAVLKPIIVKDSLERIENAKIAAIQAKEDSIAEAKEEAKWRRTKAGRLQEKYPDWFKDECEDVAKGHIRIGFTKEMLFEAWGRPNSTHVSNYGSGNQYQYCYDSQCVYVDKNGYITAYN